MDFVAILGFSNKLFAKTFAEEQLNSWITEHVHAFESFGGVTFALIPDNPRTAVIPADLYEPVLHRTYQEMAEHHGTVIRPAQPKTPRDNPFIESAFTTVKRAPEYPGRFLDHGHAVTYLGRYLAWHNTKHYHSGINYVTPQEAHQGLRQTIVAQRHIKKLSQRCRRNEENQEQKTGKRKTNNHISMTASFVA